jgi:hypothetical protein
MCGNGTKERARNPDPLWKENMRSLRQEQKSQKMNEVRSSEKRSASMRTSHYRYPVRLSEEQHRWLETMVHMSSTPAGSVRTENTEKLTKCMEIAHLSLIDL